jgi:uncharacterized membrane protein YgdD (TMEM256/DUF423 family)
MRLDSPRILAASGVLLALATVFAALGTHALRARMSAEQINVFMTATRYQFLHSLGLMGVGLAARDVASASLRWAAVLLFAGIVLFCGTLYAVAFGAPSSLATAVGGLLLIAGWLYFAVAMWRARARQS